MARSADGSTDEPPNCCSVIDEPGDQPCELVPDKTTSTEIHAFLAVAMAKHREGRFSDAEQMYCQVLLWRPDQPDAYHLLGVLAAQLNQHNDALPLFERAIAIEPAVPEYYANYANALTATGRIEDAEAALRRSILQRPDFPEALMNLAVLRRNRGALDEAEQLLNRALGLRPNWAEAQLNLANVASAKGRFDEATTLFSRALRARPQYVQAYEAFARAAARVGRLNEAATAFRRLLDFDPKNAVAQHLLAACTSDPHQKKAPEAYIRRLFDHYAPYFDESLTQLQYRAPVLIAERLAATVSPREGLRSHSLLHCAQHNVARTPSGIWQMEQRMEAVLAAQSLRGIRGILPNAGGMQPDGSLDTVL